MSILEEERKATAGTEYLRDTELSAAARGVLATLLALPQEQSITLDGLLKIFPNGKGAISSALNQLEERGYLKREQQHTEKDISRVLVIIIAAIPYSRRVKDEHSQRKPRY